MTSKNRIRELRRVYTQLNQAWEEFIETNEDILCSDLSKAMGSFRKYYPEIFDNKWHPRSRERGKK